jgi:very-short-patch-repair endonuclease
MNLYMTRVEKSFDDAMTSVELTTERQYRVENFTIDFAFPECKLNIECDGRDYYAAKDQRAESRSH